MGVYKEYTMKSFKLCILFTIVGTVLFCANGIAFAQINTKYAELFELSSGHEYSGNIAGALNDILQILRVDPNHYVANYRTGYLYYLKGQYEDSIKYYKKASAIQSKAIEPLLGLMLPLTALKQWSKAEAIGGDVLKKAPLNYLAGSRLAFIYFSQGKYQKAEAQYKTVLESFPSEIEMMLGLAWTYQKEGRGAEAKKMFEDVLSISNNNANAIRGLKSL
jgi:Tfp pilus assembly protein PilF